MGGIEAPNHHNVYQHYGHLGQSRQGKIEVTFRKQPSWFGGWKRELPLLKYSYKKGAREAAMRTLSKRTQYGMKAMLALGRRYRTGPVMIGALAREESIPIKFLEVILLDLKSRGLLASKLGRKGGYQLSRPPSTITIGSLIRIMEGPLAPLPCASETAYKPCEECEDVENCGTRIIMRRVRNAISDVLDKTTLADLVRAVESGRVDKSAGEALMYYI